MFYNAAIKELAGEVQQVLVEKDRNATFALSKSVETRVREYVNGFKFEVYMLDYWEVVNSGVPASRVAYYPGSGRRTSEYIKGILKWAAARRIPFASDKERMSFAHKLGRTHKRIGIPTNKRKLGFISDNTERYLEVFSDNLDYDILASLLVSKIAISIAA